MVMAISGYHQLFNPCLSPLNSSYIQIHNNNNNNNNNNIPPSFLNLRTWCYQHHHHHHHHVHVQLNETQQHPNIELQIQNKKKKKKRNPKPSFYDQIRDKWSVKPTSQTNKFPWQQQQPSEIQIQKVSDLIISDEPVSISDNCYLGEKKKLKETKLVTTETETETETEEDSSRISDVETRERLPWNLNKEEEEEEERGGGKQKKSNSELAEKLIPEHELKRLRNVGLKMKEKERIQVGAAGVTQALVDTIHKHWNINEVVILKFQGPTPFHMKRIHQLLESKTNGLVIWRSGSMVVLFRGLNYKLHCVKSYNQHQHQHQDTQPISYQFLSENNKQHSSQLELFELNNMLDHLGPRYVDWSGPPPLPVDADLLPSVLPGYKTPFRLLPYGVRRHLKDHQTTQFRRMARITHPHFALGRNRELQGLAAAMVKLWEKSAIAKIAIKRGVLNTANDRMAEELKRLTGGTLLSRNKEYIVFYRGNDFLPPNVTESLKERERMTMLQYQQEEERRSASALVKSNSTSFKPPMVAGTLAETVAATSQWGNQLSNEDMQKMLNDSNLARRASLVTHLQKKLAAANLKLKQAEKALEQVHAYLEPEELPTDLETITDEERLVYRKMGLSMKPYLLLGRRDVFDGTIENIHLHWKFRELVKVIARGKNFGQVKHVAISLEAESGGVLVSIDKTTKGYAIIIYRGKNYRQPLQLRPRNLLTKRQALARSIELQRREGLKHHIASLQEQMELLKSDIEDMNNGKVIDDKTFYEKMGDASISSNDDMEEVVGEEAHLETYGSEDENGASYTLSSDEN